MLKYSKSEIQCQESIEYLVKYFNLNYFDFLTLLLELKEKQIMEVSK